MITGELKNKIDSIWEIFWTGGLTNPLDVIEQMTYMMFIHDLDDSDNLRAKEAAMLGLPYQSIFAEEVQIGNTIPEAYQQYAGYYSFNAEAGSGLAKISFPDDTSMLVELTTVDGRTTESYYRYTDGDGFAEVITGFDIFMLQGLNFCEFLFYLLAYFLYVLDK